MPTKGLADAAAVKTAAKVAALNIYLLNLIILF
jgi:hypothetical protein